jgi:hypothetical protein
MSDDGGELPSLPSFPGKQQSDPDLFLVMMPNVKASIRIPIDWFDYNASVYLSIGSTITIIPLLPKPVARSWTIRGKARNTGGFAVESGRRPLCAACDVDHVAIVPGIPDIGRSLSAFSKWGAAPHDRYGSGTDRCTAA